MTAPRRVLVWGDEDDPPIERVASVLADRDVDVVRIGSALDDVGYDIAIAPEPTGALEVAGAEIPVASIDGLYLRPGPPAPARMPAAAALSALAGCLRGPVVNRPTAGRSNWSKPFQTHLLAGAGFRVPETLVTTEPAAAADFAGRYGCVVYKSVSGIRSIVATLDGAAHDRLELVRNGPVQFQRWIPGRDVRVHVLAGQWFATAVDSDAVDYRYPSHEGQVAMAATEIPDDLGRRLVALTRSLGLLLAGADLRVTPSGEWYVFEVNPSPGFSVYEDATGQPIAAAVADLLAGRGWPASPAALRRRR